MHSSLVAAHSSGGGISSIIKSACVKLFRGSIAAGVQRAVAILRDGGVVAHATDTVWGLAADADNPTAVAKIHAIKGSNPAKPLLIIAPTKTWVTHATNVPPYAKQLIAALWPGPLALILSNRTNHAHVGYRYPAHTLSRTLARTLGRPITTTSANPTGLPPARSAAEVMRVFTKAHMQPDLILDCRTRKPTSELPSTIVDCTTETPCIVRTGAVSVRKIETALSRPPSQPRQGSQ